MTLEECYQGLDGNYQDVCARIPSPRLVEKFVAKFLEDKSFALLCTAVEDGDREGAFRAAHTLKGVCANLGFTRLMNSASRLTEALRPGTGAMPEEAPALLETVRQDYAQTACAISSYLES